MGTNDLMTRYVVAAKDGSNPQIFMELGDAQYAASANGLSRIKAEVYREKSPGSVLQTQEIKVVETKDKPDGFDERRAVKPQAEPSTLGEAALFANGEAVQVPLGTRILNYEEVQAEQRKSEILGESQAVGTKFPAEVGDRYQNEATGEIGTVEEVTDEGKTICLKYLSGRIEFVPAESFKKL